VWDTATGETLNIYRGHSAPVKTVGWAQNGSNIASGSDDTTVQVWNGQTGAHIFTYQGHSKWVRSLEWSPDGEYIASAGESKVHVWRVEGNER